MMRRVYNDFLWEKIDFLVNIKVGVELFIWCFNQNFVFLNVIVIKKLNWLQWIIIESVKSIYGKKKNKKKKKEN